MLEARHREELQAASARQEQLQNALAWQEARFVEATAALGAAGRLTDQLDIKESRIVSLHSESKLQSLFRRL